MKYCLVLLAVAAIALPISAEEILRTKWQGMAIQEFASTSPIDSFAVSGPDLQGFVYLRAYSATGSGDILRSIWQGTWVQEFRPYSVIDGFEASGPDADGYVYLAVVGRSGITGPIVKSKWQGTAVQSYTAPPGYAISGFSTAGPDAEGYVTLSVKTMPAGVGEDRGVPSAALISPAAARLASGPVRIACSIPAPANVSVRVYDCTGRVARTLATGNREPGRFDLAWSGSDDRGARVRAGIYFIRLDAGTFTATSKLTLVD